MIEREEVIERVQAGHRGLQLSNEARVRHIDAIQQELDRPHVSHTTGAARIFTPYAMARNAAILLAAFVFGVVAAAGYDGVPGDRFYWAKRLAEQPVQLVDLDLVASNRIEELEELIDRRAEPPIVLTARTDAADALAELGHSEELHEALSLLAWPGPLAEDSTDPIASSTELLIPTPLWRADGGYTASLLDGHLVTVLAAGDDVVVGATGGWSSASTPDGWQLVNDRYERAYLIQRLDGTLRVTSGHPSPQGGTPGAGETSVIGRFGGVGGDVAASPTTTTASDRTSGDERAAAAADASTSTAASTTDGPTTEVSTTRTPTTSGPTTSSPTTSGPTATSGPTTSGLPTSGLTTTSAPATTSAPTGPTTTAATTTRATTATTTTTRPSTTNQPTTVPPPPAVWVGYLRNPGTGNTSSSAVLAMEPGPPPSGSLANFDTDRDGAAGLMIAKDGAGLGTSDRTKYQEWRWTAGSTTAVDGPISLTIWLAAKDFKTDERVGLLASLDMCSPTCTRLGTGQWSGPGQGGFVPVTVGFGSVSRSIPAGAELRLRIVVHDGLATTDVWFAYDAAAHPSRLQIG